MAILDYKSVFAAELKKLELDEFAEDFKELGWDTIGSFNHTCEWQSTQAGANKSETLGPQLYEAPLPKK